MLIRRVVLMDMAASLLWVQLRRYYKFTCLY
jgi:hypothetical protein